MRNSDIKIEWCPIHKQYQYIERNEYDTKPRATKCRDPMIDMSGGAF